MAACPGNRDRARLSAHEIAPTLTGRRPSDVLLRRGPSGIRSYNFPAGSLVCPHERGDFRPWQGVRRVPVLKQITAALDVPAMTTTAVTERRRLTALRAAWLFDGTSATLRANPVIILDGPGIAAIGYDIAPPQQADLVDLDGATLLPGLIDTMSIWPSTPARIRSPASPARDDTETLAAMTTAARTALRGGVTTVRDLGDRGYLSLHLRGTTGVPTIVAAGPTDHHAGRALPLPRRRRQTRS